MFHYFSKQSNSESKLNAIYCLIFKSYAIQLNQKAICLQIVNIIFTRSQIKVIYNDVILFSLCFKILPRRPIEHRYWCYLVLTSGFLCPIKIITPAFEVEMQYTYQFSSKCVSFFASGEKYQVKVLIIEFAVLAEFVERILVIIMFGY